jgi:glycosyltransferase involved in cell wall biosynthesis
MRILQLIDSLEAGGAERMAVSYANALSEQIAFSGLAVSRKEGPLKEQLDPRICYLFLDKKSALDPKALLRLRKWVKRNKITIVHAHSTSFFLAFLLKMSYPRIQLIWHDHYGDSEFLSQRPLLGLRMMLPFFNGIIAVNQKLKAWAEQRIHFDNVIYLPNFPSAENEVSERTILKGIQGKRILSLANLRVQKNHFLLLEVAKKMQVSHPEWSFHLVGKDFKDDYSRQIRNRIAEFDLENTVFLYGSKTDVKNILDQSDIAVLTSRSEGLPVALLEYGWHSKPVVVTAVGEIPLVVQQGVNGFMVGAGEVQLFYDAVVKLMESGRLQTDFGTALRQTIRIKYSEPTILQQYLDWLENSTK